MKLARCRDGQTYFWAIVDLGDNSVVPISGGFRDWAPALCADPDALDGATGDPVPIGSVTMVAPLEPGGAVYAGGANYGKHLDELGLDHPTSPTVFLKAASSVIGPDEQIRYPEVTNCLDYEVELVAVMGATALDEDDPWAGVLGFTVGNDVSARDLQFAKSVTGMDVFSAKSLKYTSPVGPWIVTRDEIGLGQPDLEMSLSVNGEVRQHARTSEMVWDIAALLSYLDSRSGIACGDLLFTGSPAGIGHATGRYLEPGDVVAATIERIGTLHNTVGPRRR